MEAGLEPRKIYEYTEKQIQVLAHELYRLGVARQETIPQEVIEEWLNTAMEMNIHPEHLYRMVKVAKGRKRYGTATTLADIIDNENYIKEYREHYKPQDVIEKQLEEHRVDLKTFKKNNPNFKFIWEKIEKEREFNS